MVYSCEDPKGERGRCGKPGREVSSFVIKARYLYWNRGYFGYMNNKIWMRCLKPRVGRKEIIMKIIKVTSNNEISVHEVTHEELDRTDLCSLVGPECEWCERVRPVRLYEKFGAMPTWCMLIDEDGYEHQLGINEMGSYLYGTDIHGKSILGDFLIVDEWRHGPEQDFYGLTDEQVENLCEQFKAFLVEKN